MVTDSNSSEKSTFPVQSTHLYGDEIERLFEEKKIYLKGKVRIHRLNQKFKSTYAIYRENERVVDLIGAPEIQKTDSYLISNLITMDLKKEIASLDQNVLGVFYQEKKEGQTGNVIIESGFFSNNKKIDRILQSGIDPRVWGQIALPEPNFY
jgi:hypothetical protein